MAKHTYEEVQKTITALVEAHRKADNGYEYSATTGNLSATLGMLIAGEIDRATAFECLQGAVKRVSSYKK